MKKTLLGFTLIILLFSGCVGNASVSNGPDELDMAIRDASDYLNDNIPAAWYNSYAPGIDNRTFLNAGVGLGATRGFTMGIPPIQASLDVKLPISLPITVGLAFKMGGGSSKPDGNNDAAGSVSSQVNSSSGQATPGAGQVSSGDSAVSMAPESDFRATIAPDNRSAVIARYNGQASNIILPGTIQGMPVSQIGEGTFRGNTRVTDVVIPEGVTTIGDNAFNGCSWLTRVTLPSTIRSIGSGAFNDCGELVTVIIPASASIEWHGDAFVGSVKLLLANQAALRQLGYTGGF